jgi:glycosyltransferase involved in cell wall biosynthesis
MKRYDCVFVTHLPAFYKVNLYREISRSKRIFVIFIGARGAGRTADFTASDCGFDSIVMNEGDFESRSWILSILRLTKTLMGLSYSKICVNGWDLPEFWWIAILHRRAKNALALESTIAESAVSGLSGLLKRCFLRRIAMVFASSSGAIRLLHALRYRGETQVTYGVGLIFKDPKVLSNVRAYTKRFLFLGRLVPEKNLPFLLEVFRKLPDCRLTLVGDGPERQALTESASSNVEFRAHVANDQLRTVFAEHDFLVLPSRSETWGLVVEEALHHGLPVIVSDRCGASDLIQDGINGLVVRTESHDELVQKIESITENAFLEMRKHVSENPVERKDAAQIAAYIRAL